MEVDVVAAPPDDARTDDDDAPVTEDLDVSLAGLMDRNEDICI